MRRSLLHRLDSKARIVWDVDKYLWLSLAYALVYIFIARERGLILAPAWVLWLLIGLGSANGLARSWTRFRRSLSPFELPWSRLNTAIDMVLIACGVCVTGGVHSDLWLLFFVAILSQSLYTGPLHTAIAATGIGLLYIVSALIVQTYASRMPWLDFWSTMGSRIFFLVIVGTYGRIISFTAEEKNRELLLLREQMAAGEERGRIAREIHDSLGHTLVAIILRLELCAKLIPRAPEEAAEILREEVPSLRAAWNEGRDLAFHLKPWETDLSAPGGLPDTLRSLITRFADRTGLPVSFSADGDCSRISPAAAYGLIRIVQEAMTNAVRHGAPTQIDVRLEAQPQGACVCTIADNGTGFVLQGHQEGFGLRGMRERADTLGGRLEIGSTPGAGTTVTVTVPS